MLQIENLHAGVVMKTSYTEVSVKLQDIIVEDLNTQTIHSTVSSYKKPSKLSHLQSVLILTSSIFQLKF